MRRQRHALFLALQGWFLCRATFLGLISKQRSVDPLVIVSHHLRQALRELRHHHLSVLELLPQPRIILVLFLQSLLKLLDLSSEQFFLLID